MNQQTDEYKEISRKLAALEHHVINLIIPIQGIAHTLGDPSMMRDLREIFGKPLMIDDRKLVGLLRDFKEVMRVFSESTSAHDLKELMETLKEVKIRFFHIERLLKDVYKNQNTSFEVVINGEKYLQGQPTIEEKPKVKRKPGRKPLLPKKKK